MGAYSNRGFSLLELLVALAIMAAVLAVALPTITGGSYLELQAAGRDIATALRQARLQAQKSGVPTALVIDVDERRITINGADKERRFPADIEVEMITAESELTGENSGGIRFYPDGTSTGGQVTLSRKGQRIRIDVEWLTGRIAQKEG